MDARKEGKVNQSDNSNLTGGWEDKDEGMAGEWGG